MSFISDYLEATSNNESPLSYHKWSCLSALSVLAGRRFWFRLGPFIYYPNFYTVLVGEPGVKKSAAMDVAKELIRKVGGFSIAATSTTKEAITKTMGHEKFGGKRFFKNGEFMEEYNQLAIFATEFTTFLGVNPIGMIDFLTSIYTEKVYDEKFKNAGDAFFTGPYITMLACMTPETAKGFLKLNILTGGFSRRTMFVWGSHGKPCAWPGDSPAQQAAMERCIAWGKTLQFASGECTFSEEAKVWWEEWYNKNYAEVKDRKPSTQAYFLTKHEFLIKTSILLAIAESESRIITPAHFEMMNKNFFAPVEENLERVFEGAGLNPNASAAAQICRMLEALDKPMSQKKLEGLFFDAATSINELRDTLSHLCNVGRLAKRELSRGPQSLGTVIGTPQAIARHTDVELAVFLQPSATPLPSSDTDQNP